MKRTVCVCLLLSVCSSASLGAEQEGAAGSAGSPRELLAVLLDDYVADFLESYPAHLQPVQLRNFASHFVQLGSGASVHPFATVGVVQPRVAIQKFHPQLESQPVSDVEDSRFYLPIRNLPASCSKEDRYRRYANYTAYGERWGLYVESLAEELGLVQYRPTKNSRATHARGT